MKRFTNGRYLGQPWERTVQSGVFVASSRSDAETIDLGGREVLPGFIDAHSHILPTGLDLLKLNLSRYQSKEEVLEAVRIWDRDQPGPGWLHATQYDQTKFPGAAHLTRHDLDSVVPDRPVLLRHSNGHASVANTAALESAQVDPGVSDPEGGTFDRDGSGVLTGVLLEAAHERVTNAAPHPELEEMVEAILRAGRHLASMGITCSSDMMTGRWNLPRELEAYRIASERGCAIRMRLWLQFGRVYGGRAMPGEELRESAKSMNHDRCRIGGIKIFADGAIGSATAAIYGQFLTTGGDGTLMYSPDKLKSMVAVADADDWPIAIHSIGDRSTDLVMDAYEACDTPSRHRIEHAMLLSEEQRDRIASIGCHVTMQPEFLIRFGHAYRAQLPPERVGELKPVRSLLDRGVRMSFNSDRPIVPGHPWDGISAATNRPDGFDESQNVTHDQAIALWTTGGADANNDIGQGRLEIGSWADFQVFDGSPGKNASVETYLGGNLVTGP
ncbi:MAG: amidohydrolase family protein [Fimbriimonadaceae bacterium]|nr:amidohydrolase family protein [Fimbriimonadaceae bacterium]